MAACYSKVKLNPYITGIPIAQCTSDTRLLKVRIVEACDLTRKSIFGSSQICCRIHLYNDSKTKTPVCSMVETEIIKRNLNPIWNEEFVFRVNKWNCLVFEVFDKCRMTRDHFLGMATVVPYLLDIGIMGSKVVHPRHYSGFFTLHRRSPDSHVSGSLHLYLCYCPSFADVRIEHTTELDRAISAGSLQNSESHGDQTFLVSTPRGCGRSMEDLTAHGSIYTTSMDINLNGLPSETGPVDEIPLPPCWKKLFDQDGRTFYVDYVKGRTQLYHPSLPIPDGWKQKTDADGRNFCVNQDTQECTWLHPLHTGNPQAKPTVTEEVSLKKRLEADALAWNVDARPNGEIEEVDLIPNGRHVMVTNENKEFFVKRFIERRITESVQPQMNAFLEGFHELIPPESLKEFQAIELELMTCGLRDIDVSDWEANTVYGNGYHAKHRVIIYFWKIVREFSPEMKSCLLQFVTGTSRVPPGGFRNFRGSEQLKKFTIVRNFHVHHLPTAHTCFNRLDLPSYETSEELRRKLLMAIKESEGFGGVD